MVSLVDDYGAFIIDLDGVVYLLDAPIPGARTFVKHLQGRAVPFVFLTNNSAATPDQYVKKLEGFDIRVDTGHVVTSSQAAGRFLDLLGDTGGSSAFVIGEGGLILELTSRGVRLMDVSNAKEADFVFVGWDRSFDFPKLKAAVASIRNGARFIATNMDATYPTPEGLWPGAGSIVAAVATGAGQEPVVVGKPNRLIVDLALERAGASAEDTLLIGDRLDTDIKAGVEAGVDTLLVLTGVSREEEIEKTGIRPTHVSASLGALLDL